MSHNAFRANFTQLLTRSDFEAATSVARMNADQASARICLLDSHAVTPTEDGLRATPDNANRLKTLRMSGLIHISSAEVTHRIVTNSQTQGRHSMTDMEAQIAEIMQVSVMVGYSAGYDCPLLLISGDGDVESVAGRLAGAARSILDAA